MTYIIFAIIFFPLLLSLAELVVGDNSKNSKVFLGIILEMILISMTFLIGSTYGNDDAFWYTPFGKFSLTTSSSILLLIINVFGLLIIWSTRKHEKRSISFSGILFIIFSCTWALLSQDRYLYGIGLELMMLPIIINAFRQENQQKEHFIAFLVLASSFFWGGEIFLSIVPEQEAEGTFTLALYFLILTSLIMKGFGFPGVLWMSTESKREETLLEMFPLIASGVLIYEFLNKFMIPKIHHAQGLVYVLFLLSMISSFFNALHIDTCRLKNKSFLYLLSSILSLYIGICLLANPINSYNLNLIFLVTSALVASLLSLPVGDSASAYFLKKFRYLIIISSFGIPLFSLIFGLNSKLLAEGPILALNNYASLIIILMFSFYISKALFFSKSIMKITNENVEQSKEKRDEYFVYFFIMAILIGTQLVVL